MGSKFTLSIEFRLVMFRTKGTLNYIHVVQRFPEKLPGVYWFAKWCVLQNTHQLAHYIGACVL